MGNKVEKFVKHDKDKPRFDYLPFKGLWEVAEVGTYGAQKYAPHNWKECDEPDRYIAAALRHITKHYTEGGLDTESSLLHLAHAAWSLMAAIDLIFKEDE